eukprot:g4093.t1
MKRWQRRRFLNLIQVVLYSPQESLARVEKRTLFEVDLQAILYHNKAAAHLLRRAAEKCSASAPFITEHLPLAERYQVLNAVLNRVSSEFSNGFVLSDLGGATRGGWYVFGLISNVVKNSHKVGDVRTTKLRVVLVREEILQAPVSGQDGYLPPLGDLSDNDRHGLRWSTINSMRQAYRRQQEAPHERNLLRVFLCVPSSVDLGRAPAARNNTPLTPSRRAILYKPPQTLGNVLTNDAESKDSPAMFTPKRR